MEQELNQGVTEGTTEEKQPAKKGRKPKARGEAASVEAVVAYLEERLKNGQLVMQEANNDLNWTSASLYAKAGVVARKKLNADLVKVSRGVYICQPRPEKVAKSKKKQQEPVATEVVTTEAPVEENNG